MTAIDPFVTAGRIADSASIETLAEAISPPGASFFQDSDRRTYFRCPRCRYKDHNPGSAEVLSTWRWRCGRCRTEGTIAELRRVALESPEAVTALLASAR